MAKWARVKDGFVIEITELDPKNRFHPDVEAEFISCNENVDLNYIYDGEFKLYAKSQDELNREEIEQIKLDLIYLDTKIHRSLEDYIDFQIKNNIINESQLPSKIKDYILAKSNLRTRLHELGR